ncbi:MAG: helix-turn-helix domain-containing protein [Sulfolobaceae archaeon]|nr:helix-turn-helix domain-containing protein [Sulfolobales archaeon]
MYKLWREIGRTRNSEPVSGSSERFPPVKKGVQVERVEDDNEEAVSLEESELNEREKQVLEAIRAGNKTLSDIVRATGLPKTTAYRRVKKLVKMGLLREVRRRGG